MRARMEAMEPLQRLMVGSLLDRIAHEIYGRYTGDVGEIYGRCRGDKRRYRGDTRRALLEVHGAALEP